MKAKLLRFTFKALRNSEYPIFVNQIVEIVGKNNPTDLHLKKTFEKLNLSLPNLAKIKAQELSNALSNKLHDFDNERDILFNGIVAQAKTYSKINLPTIAPHALVLNKLLDKHGRDISSANYNAETKRINDFLFDYQNNSEISTAVAALNMSILFDQLTTVNIDFGKLFMQRTNEEASIEKIDTQLIRAEADNALTQLLDAIEYCSLEYDNQDYTPLTNQLNDLISYYKTQLKARTTRRNSGKDVSTEEPIKI